MREFNVGDRVVAVSPVDGYSMLVGKTGIVVHIDGTHIGVEFDIEFSGGHHCNGRCRNLRGRYGRTANFELVQELDDLYPDEDEIALFDEFLLSYQN